jgi:hypothetical protein
MPNTTKITPNLDHFKPVAPKKPPNKDGRPLVVNEKQTTIEEQENEDLEVDEGIESGIPERPGNVPRF